MLYPHIAEPLVIIGAVLNTPDVVSVAPLNALKMALLTLYKTLYSL